MKHLLPMERMMDSAAILLAGTLFAFSCAMEKHADTGKAQESPLASTPDSATVCERTVTTPANGFWTLRTNDTGVSGDLGKYADYFTPTDHVVNISSSKRTPLDAPCAISSTAWLVEESAAATRAGFPGFPKIGVEINGKDIAHYASTATATRSASGGEDPLSLFGKAVSVRITSGSGTTTRSGADESEEVALYAPKLVEITNPSVTSAENAYPLCYCMDFVLGWNRDECNQNGCLVTVEWYGTMVSGESNPEAYVRHGCVVPDTGEAALAPALFEGIPDTALCYLTLYRGDVENLLVDDWSHKVLAETHAVLPFILIREITNTSNHE